MGLNTRTLFRWEQDPAGGENGTLTLWPETSREMHLPMPDFRTANALGMAINGATKDAYSSGRRSMQFDVAQLAP